MAEATVTEIQTAQGEAVRQVRSPASGLLSDTAAVMGAQAVALVTGTATAIITARALGPDGRGVLALATLWVGLFALALPMSAGYGFLYHIGQGRISLSRALSNTLTFATLVGVLGIVISCGMALAWGARLVPGVAFTYVLIAALALPAMVFGSTASLCLTGAGWIKLGALIGALSSLVSVTLCCVLVLGLRLGVTGALWAVTGGAYANSLLLLALVGRRVRLRPALDVRAVISAVRFSLKMHAGFIAQFLNYRLDRFIVNFFLGPAAVGIYGIAVVLSELIWSVPGAVGTALYPRTSSTRRDSAEVTARACRMSLLVVGALCVGAALLGPLLIPVVFGQAFAGAVPALWALLPGVFVLTAGKAVSPYLVGHNRPIVGTWGSLASLVVTIALDVALIPRWGIVGAGIASSVAYTTGAIVFVTWYGKMARVSPLRALIPDGRDVMEMIRLIARAHGGGGR